MVYFILTFFTPPTQYVQNELLRQFSEQALLKTLIGFFYNFFVCFIDKFNCEDAKQEVCLYFGEALMTQNTSITATLS